MFKFDYKRRISKFFRYGLAFSGGRNSSGHMTFRRSKGPKIKYNYVYVDHFRYFRSTYVVLRFDFNSFRNSYLMLVYNYSFGLGYYSRIEGLAISQFVKDNNFSEHGVGSVINTNWIAPGQRISSLGYSSDSCFKFGRSAGSGILIVTSSFDGTNCKLSSGKTKFFSSASRCIIGVSKENSFSKPKKAGFFINRGLRPVVRGVAKNPVDHPHGGGEGKKSPASVHRSPWGWVSLCKSFNF